MASQSASSYWTWSAKESAYFYEEWHPQTKTWQRTYQDEKNATPRTSHVSTTTRFTSSSSTVQSPSGSARPPPSRSENAGIVDAFSRLNTNAAHGTSPPGQSLIYPHQPSYQGLPRVEPSGHRRNTDSRSSHVSTPANRQGGLPYTPSSPFSPSTYPGQNTSLPLHQETGAYGPSQGGYTPVFQSAGHAWGKAPAQGHNYPQQASRASYNLDPIPGFSNLNPDEFKQMIPSRSFFTIGKVFVMFYIENAGPNSGPPNDNNSNFTSVAHGEWAHHQFRRFVVVKNVPSVLFSYCCPITTYSGQATTKRGVNQLTHTIVYSESTPPPKLTGEIYMNKDPLRITLENPTNKLDPKSRINLGRMISIDHNNRVKPIGVVEERSLSKLIRYVNSIQNQNA